MELPEVRQFIVLMGTVLLVLLLSILPVYLVSVRKPRPELIRTLWAIFWRLPLIILLGNTLYPQMAVLSAMLLIVIIIGPMELRAAVLRKVTFGD